LSELIFASSALSVPILLAFSNSVSWKPMNWSVSGRTASLAPQRVIARRHQIEFIANEVAEFVRNLAIVDEIVVQVAARILRKLRADMAGERCDTRPA
jgi:hypothetical protein